YLCTSVLSLRPSGQQHTVGTCLLIRIKLIDKILHVRVLAPCRHDADLAGKAVRHHVDESFLRDVLQEAWREGTPDSILTMTRVAGCMECAPADVGFPVSNANLVAAFVYLAAIHVVILLIVAGRVRGF